MSLLATARAVQDERCDGCGLERAHATPEFVVLSRLEQLARVLLATATRYLGLTERM